MVHYGADLKTRMYFGANVSKTCMSVTLLFLVVDNVCDNVILITHVNSGRLDV